MKRIIQTCPCGYEYEEEFKTSRKDIREDKPICFRTGVVGLKDNKPVEETIIRRVIKGDEKFDKIFLQDHFDNHPFLICPKCGAILSPDIAMKVEEDE